jgi:hypothetical protein
MKTYGSVGSNGGKLSGLRSDERRIRASSWAVSSGMCGLPSAGRDTYPDEIMTSQRGLCNYGDGAEYRIFPMTPGCVCPLHSRFRGPPWSRREPRPIAGAASGRPLHDDAHEAGLPLAARFERIGGDDDAALAVVLHGGIRDVVDDGEGSQRPVVARAVGAAHQRPTVGRRRVERVESGGHGAFDVHARIAGVLHRAVNTDREGWRGRRRGERKGR